MPGLATACARGRKGGRPNEMTIENPEIARSMSMQLLDAYAAL